MEVWHVAERFHQQAPGGFNVGQLERLDSRVLCWNPRHGLSIEA